MFEPPNANINICLGIYLYLFVCCLYYIVWVQMICGSPTTIGGGTFSDDANVFFIVRQFAMNGQIP